MTFHVCDKQHAQIGLRVCVCDRTRQMKRPAHTVNMYLNAILPHVRMACQISVQDHIHMAWLLSKDKLFYNKFKLLLQQVPFHF